MPTPSANEALAPATAARFHADYARLDLASWNRPTLVAVSGGADSLALLLLMHGEIGAHCHAATVDHGLRPQSAREAAFVAEVCRPRGIPHTILTAPMPDRANGTANLSQRARTLRYRLLERHRVAIGAGCVATAHHADDQVETLVMRLNRGAGLSGLAAIRERNGAVIRPLLGWRHRELVEIVEDAGLVPVDDPSNRDDRFDRARLRKALAGADWLDPLAIATSTRHLAQAEGALEWALDAIADRYWELGNGSASHALFDMPPGIVRRVVERCIRHVDPAARPSGRTIDRVIATLDSGGAMTVGAVMCRNDFVARENVTQVPIWTYTLAPPRRTG